MREHFPRPSWAEGEDGKLDLRTCLADTRLDPRAYVILLGRFGPGPRMTLEEIAQQLGGITRERVRQIEVKALDYLAGRLPAVEPVIDVIETEAYRLPKPGEGDGAVREFTTACQRILLDAGWSLPSEEDMIQLAALVRGLVTSGDEVPGERWPQFTFVACALPPPLREHTGVRAMIEASKEASRELTYRELAERVLRAAGQPLHWRDIAGEARKLGRRDNFSEPSLYNAVCAADTKFAQVAQGTYGLTEWGLADVKSYPEILAGVLSASGRPLTHADLRHQVMSIRDIKPSSLQMYLDMHPRFYRSINNTYGLRSWLQPPERQTLRTPRDMIEDPDSFARVARSAARGYDVDAIIASDQPEMGL